MSSPHSCLIAAPVDSRLTRKSITHRQRGSTVVAREPSRELEDACEIDTRSNVSGVGDNERR